MSNNSLKHKEEKVKSEDKKDNKKLEAKRKNNNNDKTIEQYFKDLNHWNKIEKTYSKNLFNEKQKHLKQTLNKAFENVDPKFDKHLNKKLKSNSKFNQMLDPIIRDLSKEVKKLEEEIEKNKKNNDKKSQIENKQILNDVKAKLKRTRDKKIPVDIASDNNRKYRNMALYQLFNKLYHSEYNYENVINSKTGELKEIQYVTEKTLERVKDCGNFMTFLADEELRNRKLFFGIFCHNRFCPICAKMKSTKDTVAINTMTNYLKKEKDRAFVFTTLTIPNVEGEILSETILKMNNALHRFLDYKKIKKVYKGVIKKLEVTYNKDKNNFHPHFHLLASVKKSYFKGENYIKHGELLNLWRRAMGDDTITQVNTKRLKGNNDEELFSSISEITKYMSKFEPELYQLENFEQFFYFVRGLRRKKIISYSGEFKETVKKFKNGEIDQHIDRESIEYIFLLRYIFNNQEYKVNFKIITEEERKEYLKQIDDDIKKNFGKELE